MLSLLLAVAMLPSAVNSADPKATALLQNMLRRNENPEQAVLLEVEPVWSRIRRENRCIVPQGINHLTCRWYTYLIWPVCFNVIGSIIGWVTMSDRTWYDKLEKPSFQPPNAVFGIVWTILYTILGLEARALIEYRSELVSNIGMQVMFWGQMALNWSWSPVFFIAHEAKMGLAILVMMIILNGVLMGLLFGSWSKSKASALLWYALGFLPYILWLFVATALNIDIINNPANKDLI